MRPQVNALEIVKPMYALFALAFVAPYVASEKRLPPETVQEMMRRALYSVKWYFSRTDLNTEKGKA